VSAATRELVRDSLPETLALRDLGDRELRDLSGTERVYEVGRTESGPIRSAQRQEDPTP
jgi:class 3 adenylate cyclase